MTLKKVLVGLSPLAGLGVVLWIGLRADVSLSTGLEWSLPGPTSSWSEPSS